MPTSRTLISGAPRQHNRPARSFRHERAEGCHPRATSGSRPSTSLVLPKGGTPLTRGTGPGPVSVADMSEVAVLLTWFDHTCCGRLRQVGDTFSSSIHNYRGVIYEERHPDGVRIATYPMTGRIRGIAWRPDTTRSDKDISSAEEYGPATSIESTDELPRDSGWILEFTVETWDPIPSHPIPEPRTDLL
jgi:hypothetical protein